MVEVKSSCSVFQRIRPVCQLFYTVREVTRLVIKRIEPIRQPGRAICELLHRVGQRVRFLAECGEIETVFVHVCEQTVRRDGERHPEREVFGIRRYGHMIRDLGQFCVSEVKRIELQRVGQPRECQSDSHGAISVVQTPTVFNFLVGKNVAVQNHGG